MKIDKDLQSVQEVRELLKQASSAQKEFKFYSQEQVDKIVKAMAEAGYAASEKLAKLAVEETGFGRVEHKIIKNQFGTKWVYESIKDLKTVGVIGYEKEGKIVKIAEPMGIVAALIPSTNPTSTAMFKTLISLKCRNAIVVSPHPKAVNCTLEAIKIMREAAEKAGAPKGLIQCMTMPTLEGTEALMKDNLTSVILATGSSAMVKAAYSAGKPAYGVGAGNVPAFIERTANVEKAVADIIYGTTFDNGTLCSSEQTIIADRPIREKIIQVAKKLGAYFVEGEEKEKLARAFYKDGKLNPEIVGKTAVWIANYAGFKVPENTTVLIGEATKVGKDEPFSIEKLSPILGFYTVDGWLEGCHKCIELLEFGGIGHTLVIHSNDKDIILKFALEKPAFRILVNTPSSVGAVGYTTALMPSMTLGCGTWGGSIVSENVSAKHLMNIKTLAFETNPINKGECINTFGTRASSTSFISEIEERLISRAGNPPIKQEFVYSNRYSQQNIGVNKKSSEEPKITKEEIDKIIREFNS
jgi:acetaldehyde dehydrogenase (acetylating)